MRTLKFFLILTLFFKIGLLYAADSMPAENVSSAEPSSAEYLVRPGDKLLIQITPKDSYLQDGLKQVDEQGRITLPLIGKFKIAGKTIPQAEQELIKIIDTDYLVNPDVKIKLETAGSEKKEEKTPSSQL